MDLPTRTKQKKAESESYAILLYKLRRLGIFRNLTENDYGIDFEIEVVTDDKITGRYFKAQVKSADKLNVRSSDGVPTVGGIKQSTLSYWCELSYRTHVVAYAVDLATETIYVSKPVFWSATQLIDGSGKSKSIEFIPASDEVPQDTLVAAVSLANAVSPSLPDTLYALTTALRYLRQFLELRVEAFHRDPGSDLPHPEIFRTFLEVCRILLAWEQEVVEVPDEDRTNVFSFDHWATKLDPHSTDILCSIARIPISALLPRLISNLELYRGRVINGAYYWSFKNRQFLELVHDTPLPEKVDAATLDEWGYHYDTVIPRNPDSVWSLVHKVRSAAKQQQDAATAERTARKARKEIRKAAATSREAGTAEPE